MQKGLLQRMKLVTKALLGNITYTQNAAYVLGGNPRFTNYNKDRKLLENEYYENPVYSAIADIRANYLANARYKIKNIKTGEIISFADFRKEKMSDFILKEMFRLINNPNPLQSTKEFFSMQSVMKDTFGNSYALGNFISEKRDIKSIRNMYCLWPQYMYPRFSSTSNIFSYTSKEDLFNGWQFRWNAITKDFDTREILHRKDTNIQLKVNDDLVLGKSKLLSLTYPLSNIKIAYESRNVIAQDRGMRGIISSNEGDSTGKIPMRPGSKKDLQDEFTGDGGYGLRKNQNQFIITEKAINAQMVDQDVRKLGLLDEIASDAIIVAHKYGVPEVLIKLYLQGATFENQEKSEIRMLQNTTIPEATDIVEDLNNWLNVREYGYEYVVSFDHLPVLQEDLKNKSVTNLNNHRVYKELFFSGGCTYNVWLQAIEQNEIEEAWANRRITELDERELAIVTNNFNLLNNAKETK